MSIQPGQPGSSQPTKRYSDPPPQYFLQYRLNIHQLVPVFHSRQSLPTSYPINLLPRPLLHIRIQHHRQHKVMQRRDNGVCASRVQICRTPLDSVFVLIWEGRVQFQLRGGERVRGCAFGLQGLFNDRLIKEDWHTIWSLTNAYGLSTKSSNNFLKGLAFSVKFMPGIHSGKYLTTTSQKRKGAYSSHQTYKTVTNQASKSLL